MKKYAAFLVFAITLFATNAQAVWNPVGQWQGTLKVGNGLRIVLKISNGEKGQLKGLFYSIDQSGMGVPIDISVQGAHVQFSLNPQTHYEGTLSRDGRSIVGRHSLLATNQSVELNFQRATAKTAWPTDTSPHTTRLVAVDRNVRLEVLDWGGTGRPLVFLAGLGDTAHDFDKFALHFTDRYHVYGITRRGYGASSKPDPATGDYSSDRLGRDVIAVLDALKLEHPVLAGHSFGGAELSYIGSHVPDRVGGLVYLDAGYAYAYYAPGHTNPLGVNLIIGARELQTKLDQLQALSRKPQNVFATGPKDILPQIQELQASLADFERDLSVTKQAIEDSPPPEALPLPDTLDNRIAMAVIGSSEKYTDIKSPVLSLYAIPQFVPPNATPDQRAAANLRSEGAAAQAEAFAAGVPSARVVRLPNANHVIWLTNEIDVVREMNAFMDGLPKQ